MLLSKNKLIIRNYSNLNLKPFLGENKILKTACLHSSEKVNQVRVQVYLKYILVNFDALRENLLSQKIGGGKLLLNYETIN